MKRSSSALLITVFSAIAFSPVCAVEVDTDHDGFFDSFEIANHTNPNDPASHPAAAAAIGSHQEYLYQGKPFFPVMAFGQGSQTWPFWKMIGVNTQVSNDIDIDWTDPDHNHWQTADSYLTRAKNSDQLIVMSAFGPEEQKLIGTSRLIGWNTADEADVFGPTVDVMKPLIDNIRQHDPRTPVWQNFTYNFIVDPAIGWLKDDAFLQKFRDYSANVDVLGFDLYPVNFGALSYYPGGPETLYHVGIGIDQVRDLGAPQLKPTFEWIECNNFDLGDTQRGPTDVEMRWEAWNAIIHGAKAIGWFSAVLIGTNWQNFYPNNPQDGTDWNLGTDAAPVLNMQDPILKEMVRVDRQVTELSGIILSATSDIRPIAQERSNRAVDLTTRIQDGKLWIFCQNADMAGNAEDVSFEFPQFSNDVSVSLYDENNRHVAMAGHKFEDHFAPLEVHIYSIDLAQASVGGLKPQPKLTAKTSARTAAPATAFFDSAGSLAGSGTIQSVLWNFGDGWQSSDAAPSHTFATDGVFTVSLTVTNSNGLSSTVSTELRFPDADLLIYLPLENDLHDVSGNNLDGQPGTDSHFSAGQKGMAYEFNGNATNRFTLPKEIGTRFAAARAVTFSAWIYNTTSGWDDGGLFAFHNAAGQIEWGVQANQNLDVRMDWDPRANSLLTDGAIVTTINSWHQVTVTYDAQNIRIYIDGALRRQATPATQPSFDVNGTIDVGAGWFGSTKRIGKIDNVAFFKRILSDQEIKDMFDADSTLLSATHRIVASAQSGGSISPSGNISVRDGAAQTFRVQPSAGHVVEDVIIDGISKGSMATYTFINTRADHTIEVHFAAGTSNDPPSSTTEINGFVSFPSVWRPGGENNMPIEFSVASGGDVSLEIYARGGSRVVTLADGHHASGRYKVLWDLTNGKERIASGTYLLVLEINGERYLKKIAVIK